MRGVWKSAQRIPFSRTWTTSPRTSQLLSCANANLPKLLLRSKVTEAASSGCSGDACFKWKFSIIVSILHSCPSQCYFHNCYRQTKWSIKAASTVCFKNAQSLGSTDQHQRPVLPVLGVMQTQIPVHWRGTWSSWFHPFWRLCWYFR